MIRSAANAIAMIAPNVISLIAPSPPVDGSSTPLLFGTVVDVAVYVMLIFSPLAVSSSYTSPFASAMIVNVLFVAPTYISLGVGSRL